jgi:hypothetical protein
MFILWPFCFWFFGFVVLLCYVSRGGGITQVVMRFRNEHARLERVRRVRLPSFVSADLRSFRLLFMQTYF